MVSVSLWMLKPDCGTVEEEKQKQKQMQMQKQKQKEEEKKKRRDPGNSLKSDPGIPAYQHTSQHA